MDTIRYSMDRHWRFTQSQQSVLPKSLSHETVYAFSKGDGAQGPAMLNFNDDGWQDVTLPHDWQHLEPFDLTGIPSHGYQRTGVGWYRRTFVLPKEDSGSDISLVFDGISGISDVYVNGAKLYHNESCYNGFSLSLSDVANYGVTPNVIAVRVDKTVWEGWWYEGCGINRHVWLIKRPKAHIQHDGVWVKPIRQEQGWLVQCEWQVENSGDVALRVALEATVLAADGTVVNAYEASFDMPAYHEDTHRAGLSIPAPLLWDVDHPHLYTLKTTITSSHGTDTRKTRFGLRAISVDAQTGFHLNGRRMKLLGTCNHLDHAGIGAAIPKELWRHRISLLKRMGSNAYRCAHNPPPKELLEVCDELGMLVMDENRSFSTAPDALRLLRSMVRRDRNHPCVVMYSLFNEEPMQGSAKGRRIAKRQSAVLRQLDDTRPVLGAFNGGMFEPDGAATALHITGINYFLDSFDMFHRMYPNQPIVSSETVSAFSTRGCCVADEEQQVFTNYDEACADWGETVREANTAVLSRDFIMGMFVWTGFDYRGEPTPYEWPSVSSHFGIMDACGFPKDSYYLYQAFWQAEPRLHLLPHWNHRQGQRVRVMAYSNCDAVELFINGESQGKKQNNMATQLTWEVRFQRGTLYAVGYQKGRKCAEDMVRTAGAAKRLALETPIPTLYPDTDSIALVNISCVDENGLFCPLEKARVSVRVQDGVLMGVGNGNPNNHDMDNDTTVRLFYGRCQVLVAALPESTAVTVAVDCPGLPPASVTIPVEARPFPGDVPVASMRVLSGWRMSHTPQMEKPGTALSISQNDMNSMEPVTFDGSLQTLLDGHRGAYALYRTTAEVGDSAPGRHLVLNRVQGTVEVYAGKRLLGRQACFTASRMELPLPITLSGECILTLIVQNKSVDGRAGVIEPVTLVNSGD